MPFLADAAARPLSTTVSRYQRLHLSRRRGNAIRQDLVGAGIIEAVPIATRSGQVMLHELTDYGRTVCDSLGIDPGSPPRASLEHTYWAHRVARDLEAKGYEVALERPIDGDGVVDVVASRPGERIAVEIETGNSDIRMNLEKHRGLGSRGRAEVVLRWRSTTPGLRVTVRPSAAGWIPDPLPRGVARR